MFDYMMGNVVIWLNKIRMMVCEMELVVFLVFKEVDYFIKWLDII